MNYAFYQTPFSKAAALPLIEEVLERPMKRSDIQNAIVRLHCWRGGERGTSDPIAVTKKALQTLVKQGRIIRMEVHGYYKPAESTLEPKLVTEPELEQEQEHKPKPKLDFQHVIGDGPQSVYAYYLPEWKTGVRDGEPFAIKIGKSNNEDPGFRVLNQGIRASFPVGIVHWRVSDCHYYEQTLHQHFKPFLKPGAGKEIFVTTPEKVVNLIHELIRWHTDL